jgi:hypothetical protein
MKQADPCQNIVFIGRLALLGTAFNSTLRQTGLPAGLP